jgi:hypothetical protein
LGSDCPNKISASPSKPMEPYADKIRPAPANELQDIDETNIAHVRGEE